MSIGLICGDGLLPETIIRGCLELKKPLYAIALDCNKHHPASLSYVPHSILSPASIGRAIKILKKEGIKEIVFAGSINRPKWSELRPDIMGVRLLTRIITSHPHGDNALLTIILHFFENEGFTILGADQLLNHLCVSSGCLTIVKPDEKALSDIALGKQIIQTIGHLDIGQAVAIQNGRVLGVEAAEGTDGLIHRCQPYMKQENSPGIVVKMKKPHQDKRIDLPTIGPDTIINLHKSGFQGIAVEAKTTIVLEQQHVIELANRHRLFIYGL